MPGDVRRLRPLLRNHRLGRGRRKHLLHRNARHRSARWSPAADGGPRNPRQDRRCRHRRRPSQRDAHPLRLRLGDHSTRPPEAHVCSVERFEPTAVSKVNLLPKFRWAERRSSAGNRRTASKSKGCSPIPSATRRANAIPCCSSSTAARWASSRRPSTASPGVVSDRRLRTARLRRAAAQPARLQRLRQEVSLRQLRRLGRRRLSRPHDRRRSRHQAWASPTRTAWASWAGATAAS